MPRLWSGGMRGGVGKRRQGAALVLKGEPTSAGRGLLGQIVVDVLLDAGEHVVGRCGLELGARDVLVELDVAVADALHHLGRHLGDGLVGGAVHLEAVVEQPLAHKFLAELLLRFAGSQAFGVALGVEVARGVGRVYFVHQVDLAVVFAKLVLRVDQYEAALGGYFRAALEEGEGVLLEQGILLGSGEAACQNFLFRDVLVVLAYFSLGGGGDDGRGELLVFTHALGQGDAANLAHTALVGTPGAAAQVAAHNHFNGEALAHHAHGDHGVGRGEFPVRADVGGGVEELRCNLVEHLTLEGDALGQNDVEGRNAVGGHHHEAVAQGVDVAHLAVVHGRLAGELEFSVS